MKLLDKVRILLNYRCYVEKTLAKAAFLRKADDMTKLTLNSTEMGVSEPETDKPMIVVSLTTYGKRIYEVYLAIESIMQGTLKPNKIILWLSDDLRSFNLPLTLQKQIKRGLEIGYCKDYKSYKKIIPTLKKFHEDVIITIDDDVIYNYDLVENLVNAYKENPSSIHACRMHRIRLDANNRKPLTYFEWKWNVNDNKTTPLNFLTGVGGVLYPPNSFDSEVMNEEVFMDICKSADDIWLYAMALKKGTPINKAYTHNKKGEDYWENVNVQDVGLFNENIGGLLRNDMQLKAVLDRYDLYNSLLNNDLI